MAKGIDKILADIQADLDRKLADSTTEEAKESAKDMAERLYKIFVAAAVHARSRSFLGQIEKMFKKKHMMASMMRMPGRPVPTDEDWEWCKQVNDAIKSGKPLPAHPDLDIRKLLENAKFKFD